LSLPGNRLPKPRAGVVMLVGIGVDRGWYSGQEWRLLILNIDSFDEIVTHVGHNVIVVGYGREGGGGQYENVAIECETCDCLLLEWDRPRDPAQAEPHDRN